MTREMNKEKNEGEKTDSAVSLQSGASIIKYTHPSSLGFKIFSLAFASLKSFKIILLL